MSFELSRRSLDRLNGVHPDIVAVIRLAIKKTEVDFTVLEGLRSLDRQRDLFARGASKTMNSRHLTGHAVDIAPFVDGEVSWHWPNYHQLAPIIKEAAEELGVDIEWGGDWKSFKDGPHWQLPWAEYGKDDMTPRAKGVSRVGPRVNQVVQVTTPVPPPKPVEVPPEVRKVVDDANKAPTSSTSFLAVIMGFAGSGYAWWQAADTETRVAITAVVLMLLYIGRERLRKIKLGRVAKEALGL